jgi:hypothetical protein
MEQERAWTLKVLGREYLVSLTDGEGGKLIPRVDGKAAAKALAPEESERLLNVGGAVYLLQRNESGFVLEMQTPAPPPVPANPPRLVPATFDGYFLKPRTILWFGMAIAICIPFLWYSWAARYTNLAQRRVEHLLTGMTGDPDAATIGLWARNTRRLADARELSWASDHYDQWRAEKGIPEKIASWKMIGVESVSRTPKTARVTVTIDDQKVAMIVPENQPISWASP